MKSSRSVVIDMSHYYNLPSAGEVDVALRTISLDLERSLHDCEELGSVPVF